MRVRFQTPHACQLAFGRLCRKRAAPQPQRVLSGATKVRESGPINAIRTFVFKTSPLPALLLPPYCLRGLGTARRAARLSTQMSSSDHLSEDLNALANWRSILTLVTFLIASKLRDGSILERRLDLMLISSDLVIIFPFRVPVFVYRPLLVAARISPDEISSGLAGRRSFVRIRVPIDLNTAPLIGVLFLLSTTAIGRKEVREGTLGANNIVPIDIVLFALTVGYIVRSIDASGLIRYLAIKVATKTENGHRLFLYLYSFFFAVGVLFGNDPVIQMGALFLTYLIRLASNIRHPRAWIHAQFAAANIASTILTSSNTTNVVIAQAFKINFARYTASLVVPVVITAVLLFPLLLYVVFNYESLIPPRIKVRELMAELQLRPPVNPHIPNARGLEDATEDASEDATEERFGQFELMELMNPFLDKGAAVLGIFLMFTSLTVLLALTALGYNDIQVFWVTLPASFIMFCWDTAFGWLHRRETREIARRGMEEVQRCRAEAEWRQRERISQDLGCCDSANTSQHDVLPFASMDKNDGELKTASPAALSQRATFATPVNVRRRLSWPYKVRHIANMTTRDFDGMVAKLQELDDNAMAGSSRSASPNPITPIPPETGTRESKLGLPEQMTAKQMDDTTGELDSQVNIKSAPQPRKGNFLAKFESISNSLGLWFKQTLPTVAYTARHIPFSNIPFALPLFILVQSLASTGWVTIMARGWGAWVDKTGVVGSICGMALLSMILCNVSLLLHLINFPLKERTGSDHRNFTVRRHKHRSCYPLFTCRAGLAGPPSPSRPTYF